MEEGEALDPGAAEGEGEGVRLAVLNACDTVSPVQSLTFVDAHSSTMQQGAPFTLSAPVPSESVTGPPLQGILFHVISFASVPSPVDPGEKGIIYLNSASLGFMAQYLPKVV